MPKIKDIRVWDADLGNTKPYTIAFKTVDDVRNAFVEIVLDNGITGIGSGNPSEYVVGESFAQCLEALELSNLEFLVGRDIREFQQLTFEVWKSFPRNPSARAALDIALYDAFTKYLKVPLVKFLGQKIKSLPTSNTIGIKNVEETVREAKDFIQRGFTILKVKLGKDLQEDIERLVKLREHFGNDIVIRIDANQGYDSTQTVDFYNKTKALNIELIEQPLPAKAVNEMKALPAEIRKKIKAAFHRHATVDSANVIVAVKDTTATLTGTVRSWTERKDAEDVVWSMPGITDVENKLEIKHDIYVGE